MLVEIAEDGAMPWELASMTVEVHQSKRDAYRYGPGALAETEDERLRIAREAARELLRHGLVEIRTGRDFAGDGEETSKSDGESLLRDRLTWRWPAEPEREIYAWFTATPEGQRAADVVTLDDVPRVPIANEGARVRTTAADLIRLATERWRSRRH